MLNSGPKLGKWVEIPCDLRTSFLSFPCTYVHTSYLMQIWMYIGTYTYLLATINQSTYAYRTKKFIGVSFLGQRIQKVCRFFSPPLYIQYLQLQRRYGKHGNVQFLRSAAEGNYVLYSKPSFPFLLYLIVVLRE